LDHAVAGKLGWAYRTFWLLIRAILRQGGALFVKSTVNPWRFAWDWLGSLSLGESGTWIEQPLWSAEMSEILAPHANSISSTNAFVVVQG
jgi:hypothetical protein